MTSTLWYEILNWTYVLLQQFMFLALAVFLIWGGISIKNHGLGLESDKLITDPKTKKPVTPGKPVKGQYKRYAWLYVGMWVLSSYFIIYQVIFALISMLISGSSSSTSSSTSSY
ncbi:hypothetical protein [Oenococcus sicerae]|uniref:hypothetical protein n=1 Tax=Oenococcus sicerae TaxID=2203724 RepID=UPI0010B31A93|nr:hypothetical protein OAL24_01381 [Oenococcus sicerae]